MSTSKITAGKESSAEAYHHGDLRRALLDAATALVEREGAAALTIREAARRAGVSHNAPYRHFTSLEALLAAVAARGFAELRAALEPAFRSAGEAPAARKAAMGRAFLDFSLGRPRLYRLMFGGEFDRSADDLGDEQGRAFDLLSGAVRDDDTAFAEAIAALALAHGLASLILAGIVERDDPVIAEILGGAPGMRRS